MQPYQPLPPVLLSLLPDRQRLHTHTARRVRSEAARQADFDEFRHDVRANGCRGLGERDYSCKY